jgi:polysaccharide export outer membrane protein
VQSGLLIGAGDLLEINIFSVFGTPEVNSKARVSTSGGVSVPLLGNVQVTGLTTEEAEARIEERLRDEQILKQPHVTVFVSEYANQGVSVLGEVSKPSVYPMLVSRRLLDLISEAGGLTPTAGKVITITHRTAPQEPTRLAISRDPNKNFADNVDILPGDTIVVAKAGIIYVVGAVGKPGGFTIDTNEGFTVLQAIALADLSSKLRWISLN